VKHFIFCTPENTRRLLAKWAPGTGLPRDGREVTILIPPNEKIAFANAMIKREDTPEVTLPGENYRVTFINRLDRASS
jgi:hypothetical protein